MNFPKKYNLDYKDISDLEIGTIVKRTSKHTVSAITKCPYCKNVKNGICLPCNGKRKVLGVYGISNVEHNQDKQLFMINKNAIIAAYNIH